MFPYPVFKSGVGSSHHWYGSLVLAVGLLLGLPAAAQSPVKSTTEQTVASSESKKKAMDHFETGLRLYEDGDFSLALIEFERAYSYVPDYRVLYNIGQVSIQLGRYARAAQALKQYLAEGGTAIAAARANSVRDDLKMLEGRTAHLVVASNVDGAEVLLDDLRLGVTPMAGPMLVDAGEHRLTVQKRGFLTHTERIVLAGRDEGNLQIDLAEEPKSQVQTLAPVTAPPAGPVSSTRDQSHPKPLSTRTKLLYVGAGTTGLLAVGWAISGYLGIKAAGDLHDALQHPAPPGGFDAMKTKAQRWMLASDILGAATLVTGGTTLYFVLRGPGHDPSRGGMTQLRLGLGPGAAQISGSF